MRRHSRNGWRRARRAVLLAGILLAGVAGPAAAKDYYVAPDGRADAKGTKDDPLDLATAIGRRSPAKPGDTIWLGGGTYAAPFDCRVAGREGAPVTVRAVPGGRATLDCRLPKGAEGLPDLFVTGDWSVFRDLEVTCSAPKRRTGTGGSHPSEIRRGGVTCRGSHVKFINLLVHDCAGGFGFWSSGEGGEIYGCLIYNNGWIGPDRGHGHAVYAQNKTGTKRLVDNVMFNQFSFGVHVYGSSRAFLRGFHLEGNVSFNNGSAAGAGKRTPAILIGGGSAAERIAVVGNYTYGDAHGGGAVRLGYSARTNKDVVVRGNYFVGSTSVQYWQRVTFEGNTVVAPSSLVRLALPKDGDVRKYEWNRNVYRRTAAKWEAFALDRQGGGRALDFKQWQKEGLDVDSRYAQGSPKGVKVIVRPNRYERGRAHVIVYNWDRRDRVKVDLGDLLRPLQKYRIVSAQDFFGKPVVEGKYDLKPVELPMTEYRAAPPIGMPDHKPPATGPTFNVFVVLPG
jgi:hypothetical protein